VGSSHPAYILRTYDKLVKPEIRAVLQHTDFLFDPIINYQVKTKEQFLSWLRFKSEEEYIQCIASMEINERKRSLRKK
jgi:hypothetical protein